ncbi:MAG TPA: hypothetical protein VMB73_03950 [Acetobacteraceae bacterium]|jgi:hypothetical protein|nr:hypothetical protein [Acetobacteraceae bacterium]
MSQPTRRTIATAALSTFVAAPTLAQPAAPARTQDQGELLTIFPRHDGTRTLSQINAELKQSGFFRRFPPPNIEVVSWYVMMGSGQVVTLNVPPSRLREVNRAIEETAWGSFRPEFYPTYDYRQGAADIRKEMQRWLRSPHGSMKRRRTLRGHAESIVGPLRRFPLWESYSVLPSATMKIPPAVAVVVAAS